MKNIAYKILDYFYENKRARDWWMYIAWAGLTLTVAWLPWWHYALVILFAVLIHWHGLVDGAREAMNGVEGKDE